jgi:hypothetical protein
MGKACEIKFRFGAYAFQDPPLCYVHRKKSRDIEKLFYGVGALLVMLVQLFVMHVTINEKSHEYHRLF